eukprot:GAHX01002918.1.p2 GENE.GAHX01002918.1~~GAHX01002918.1.p2  ORF type:complete len:50 (-),score=8.25 GAHX01002918.1:513-662(-)
MTWGMIMIDLAMLFAITVHIQEEFEAASVKQGGMDDAAAAKKHVDNRDR